MTDQEFFNAAFSLNVLLNPEQIALFTRYEKLLKEWSDRSNLVSKGDRNYIRERHFLECLTVVPFLPRGKQAILDLGSGAGLPGIPVKIALPCLCVFLLEASRKKALFLRHAVNQLQLSGLYVIHERAEQLSVDPHHRGCYRVVLARAVTTLQDLWRLSAPLLEDRGMLIAFKAPGSLSVSESILPLDIKVKEYVVQNLILRHVQGIVTVERMA